jgi:D-serine deaminase-like pyridoxal phosphate-dependent protein
MGASVGPVGRSKWELDTPALVVDLPTMERNVTTMAKRIIGAGVNWRPHTKGQKVPAIAHLELAAGAIGVTCAKLGEAEVMAAAGIRDILIANQIVGAQKVARLVNLRKHADVIVAVDSPENVAELSAAAAAKGVEQRVVIEVDVGMSRCGVAPGEKVVELARTIRRSPGLKFAGVMGWEAPCTRLTDPAEKRACVEEALGGLVRSAELCRQADLPVEIVSCGGTGTYWVSATIPGITELQAGGGIFHDVHYAEHFGVDHEFAMTVMTTVISRPTPERIIVDAGLKTMSSQAANPRPLNVGEVQAVGFSAEHGKIELAAPNTDLKVGDKVEWVVGYTDTTVLLHDELYAVRDGAVEVVWPILGRGKLR